MTLAPVLVALGFMGMLVLAVIATMMIPKYEGGSGSSELVLIAGCLPPIVGGWFLGRRLGRRAGERVALGTVALRTVALIAPACLCVGLLATLLAALPDWFGDGFVRIFSNPDEDSFVGIGVWVLVFAVTSWSAVWLAARGRGTSAALVGVAGILLASDAAVTVSILISDFGALHDRSYAALWGPTAMLLGEWPLLVPPDMRPSDIVEYTEFYPHLLIATGLFGLGYLYSAARVAVRRPQPDGEPAVPAETQALA